MTVEAEGRFVVRGRCPACDALTPRTLMDLPYSQPPVSDYLIDFYGTEPGSNILSEVADLHYTVVECRSCGLIWQRTAPADDLIERLYEQWIDVDESLARDRHQALAERMLLVQEVAQILAAFRRPPGTLRFLDFGMGWGRWLQIARGFGCQVWGTELSEARLAHARRLAIPTVTWDEIPRYGFDFINTEQVFEHLVEPYATLSHLRRGLAPDGLIKISVPPNEDIHRRLKANDWKAPKFTRRSLNAVAPLEHLNCYHGRSLPAIAKRAGLEPAYLPLSAYYRVVVPIGGPKNVAKQLIKPLYRSVFKRGPYRFFRRPASLTSAARSVN
jgi:SAM-dependent methyltransferase